MQGASGQAALSSENHNENKIVSLQKCGMKFRRAKSGVSVPALRYMYRASLGLPDGTYGCVSRPRKKNLRKRNR